ncbi:hypothetical protein [Paenibacillus sp. Mc5Re-14]|uniref:hypothetical protein n=1 Tax=Paenibacillus sp. Mc5Re-14 TaxID=1030529 RepID=UPI000ABE0D59|nr:hypothetical protein [Paenibacillus sp. Mc5Re-14]
MHIQERIAKIIEAVRKEIKSNETMADYEMRGSSRYKHRAELLFNQIKFFEYGREGVVPPEWNHEYGHLLDDEWTEYQRLKEKFNGK